MESDGVADRKGPGYLHLDAWGLRLGVLQRTRAFYAFHPPGVVKRTPETPVVSARGWSLRALVARTSGGCLLPLTSGLRRNKTMNRFSSPRATVPSTAPCGAGSPGRVRRQSVDSCRPRDAPRRHSNGRRSSEPAGHPAEANLEVYSTPARTRYPAFPSPQTWAGVEQTSRSPAVLFNQANDRGTSEAPLIGAESKDRRRATAADPLMGTQTQVGVLDRRP